MCSVSITRQEEQPPINHTENVKIGALTFIGVKTFQVLYFSWRNFSTTHILHPLPPPQPTPLPFRHLYMFLHVDLGRLGDSPLVVTRDDRRRNCT